MQHVDSLVKYYYAPIKANRKVSKTCSSEPYRAVSKLTFLDEEIKLGLLDDYMKQQLRSPSLRYLEPCIA